MATVTLPAAEDLPRGMGLLLRVPGGKLFIQLLYGLDAILDMMAGNGTVSPMSVAEGVE